MSLTNLKKTERFEIFDRVAGSLEGKHDGPPWYDGLVYETLRGASDLLISYPDKRLEERIDGYMTGWPKLRRPTPTVIL
jgi:hypothetical protein